MHDKAFIIAIDGPAASGKGTLARNLAEHYGFHHLDTGLTYRAVAKALIDQGVSLDDEAHAAQVARNLDLKGLDRNVLSAHEIGEAASKVAVMPQVREALMQAQQKFAQSLPGTVLDGRDIGTVVCPDAPVKLYITASAEVRAERRFNEMRAKNSNVEYSSVLADLKRRDERDINRSASPLKPACDAHLIDTSKMDIEAAFLEAKMLIDSKMRD